MENEFKILLERTKQIKSDDWSLEDLEKVLKTLKLNQSQDVNGFANEMFRLENVGDDLKNSLLIMFNKIKRETNIPMKIRDAYISAIPKGKKNPLDLENQRGIFLINKVKAILMKLVYNSTINTIEENLSESNIGARKERSTRDHVFVLNSIINETTKDKTKEPLDFVYYDIRQCYDSLWAEKNTSGSLK